MAESVSRPLVVTDDDALLDQVLGLALAAGQEPSVARDPAAAATSWSSASLVVVGSSSVDACLSAGLPRRSRVFVVVPTTEEPVDLWPRMLRLGAEDVACLPESAAWLRAVLATADTPSSRVVAVVGACGGVGASTLAAGLAVSGAAEGLDTVLVDADPFGGGLELLLGLEHIQGVRWPDLVGAEGRVSRGSLVPALPATDGVSVLGWGPGPAHDLPPPAFSAVLDGLRHGGDLVVVDLGRGGALLDPMLERASTVLLVAVPRVRAVSAAAALLVGSNRHADVRPLVRNGGRAGMDALDVAEALDRPLAATIPHDQHRVSDEELGLPPAVGAHGGLRRLCVELLATVPRAAA